MKKILLSLLLAATAAAQTVPIAIQKASGTNVITNGPVVVGSGNSITVANGGSLVFATGSTLIPAVGGIPWTALGSIPSPTVSFTGDATGTTTLSASAGVSTGLTLATVNSNVGSFGDSSHVTALTVNAKGLVTAASNVAVTPASIAALPIASNLGDLNNPATARGNLGVAIGSNVEAWSATLDSWAAKTVPAGTVADLSSVQTLTNKTISGASNTLSSIGNGSLTNSAITIAGVSTALGGTITQDTITGLSSTGIVKRTASNTLAIAASGTDYLPITGGTGITTLGTIGTGTWQGTVIVPLYGGTGVSTFGGTNTLLFTSTANTLTSLTTANNGVLVTSSGGVPSIASTLPAAVQANITAFGAASGTSINSTPIGATTPSTGAFTTLGATGTSTLGVVNSGALTSSGIVQAVELFSTGPIAVFGSGGTGTIASDIVINGGSGTNVGPAITMQRNSVNQWTIGTSSFVVGASPGNDLMIANAGGSVAFGIVNTSGIVQAYTGFNVLSGNSVLNGPTGIGSSALSEYQLYVTGAPNVGATPGASAAALVTSSHVTAGAGNQFLYGVYIGDAYNVTAGAGQQINPFTINTPTVIGTAGNVFAGWQETIMPPATGMTGALLVNGITQINGYLITTPTGNIGAINIGNTTVDPSSPNEGDMWDNTTTHALKAHINGVNLSLGGGLTNPTAAASMAAMKLLPTGAWVNGTVISLAGFYNPGDGGGGGFVWESSDVSADNGGTVIQVTGVATGRLHRIQPSSNYASQLPNTTLDIRWFGAIPDVTTDCTPGIAAAENSAIFGGSNETPTLYAPAGQYLLKTKLDFSTGSAGSFTLKGDGRDATIFVCSFTSSATAMWDLGNFATLVSIRDCGFKFQTSTTILPVYLYMHNLHELDVDNVRGGNFSGTFGR